MEPIKEGVLNLVNHCAEVKKDDEVLILNEYGKVGVGGSDRRGRRLEDRAPASL